jgi:hypothetical protein
MVADLGIIVVGCITESLLFIIVFAGFKLEASKLVIIGPVCPEI